MEQRRIGSLQVSAVGMGGNNFGMRIDAAKTEEVVLSALEAGINFFDTADVYGSTKSEEFLGQALGKRRDEAVVATKFGGPIDAARPGTGEPAYVRSACEDSLQRLGTDRIDLYYLHRPDPNTPIAETLGALNELVAEGKVREIGCSNFSAERLREAEAAVPAGGVGFVAVQNRLSLLERADTNDALAFCAEKGMAYIPFSPLGSGLLTGKFRRDKEFPAGARVTNLEGERRDLVVNDRNLEIVEELIAYCEAQGMTLLEVAFASLLAEPAVASVIAGATSAEQVRANAAAGQRRLSAEEIAAIDAIAPVVASTWPPLPLRDRIPPGAQ